MDKSKLFRRLPKVDQILANKKIKLLLESGDIPRDILIESIRETIDEIRDDISKGIIREDELDKKLNIIPDLICNRTENKLKPKLRKVINGTGIIIHTNLGRSLISEKITGHIIDVMTNYSNLEYDLENGKRGSRYSHLEDIITKITGAESALVVNNNGAAVLLILSSIANKKQVIVSRGELVEIGGSFRVPDVMKQSGAVLIEVGTTNKTHLWDYEDAINEETAALLKVHTSNYRILGFTETVALEKLVQLGQKKNIPVIEDIGSGVLIDMSKYGLQHEPTVQESIKAGVDIVSFSGDKLLGGPQAGIIIGKKKYIDIMKKHPLNRALRIDKYTIAALEATLRLYLDEEKAIKEIPTLRMMTFSLDELESRAEKLLKVIKDKVDSIQVRIADQFSQVGGGAMPLQNIPTKAIEISFYGKSLVSIENNLRNFRTPIIVRVNKEKMYLDLRTIKDKDFNLIAEGLKFAVDNA